MSQLPILQYPDPRLRRVAQAVTEVTDSIRQLADDMLDTMYAARGIGLAATQVDQHVRMLVLDVSEQQDQPKLFINPELLEREGQQQGDEGCLSIPGEYAAVERAERIRVRALDRDGTPFELEADGLMAVCIQHEIDHLDGKLFVDYLSPMKRRMIERRMKKQKRQEQREDLSKAV
ncbi:MAG: peptide deformylase [Pseudomonadota bacterium]